MSTHPGCPSLRRVSAAAADTHVDLGRRHARAATRSAGAERGAAARRPAAAAPRPSRAPRAGTAARPPASTAARATADTSKNPLIRPPAAWPPSSQRVMPATLPPAAHHLPQPDHRQHHQRAHHQRHPDQQHRPAEGQHRDGQRRHLHRRRSPRPCAPYVHSLPTRHRPRRTLLHRRRAPTCDSPRADGDHQHAEPVGSGPDHGLGRRLGVRERRTVRGRHRVSGVRLAGRGLAVHRCVHRVGRRRKRPVGPRRTGSTTGVPRPSTAAGGGSLRLLVSAGGVVGGPRAAALVRVAGPGRLGAGARRRGVRLDRGGGVVRCHHRSGVAGASSCWSPSSPPEFPVFTPSPGEESGHHSSTTTISATAASPAAPT